MDLIYTDTNRIEQGVLKEAVCDFAFGYDENDFEVVTTKDNAVIELGGYIYYDDTEYGGRVDEMETASNGDELKYRGRTWHGILNSYIVEGIESKNILIQDDGFYLCTGKVSDIINDLVSFFGITDVFAVDDTEIEVETPVTRRLGMYDFLLELFRKNELKMNLTHSEGKCHIVSSYAIDYTDSQYFDDDKMNLSVVNGKKFTNHFVLHTIDEDEGKHYICHLFTDGNGAMQPYFIPDKDNDMPLRDGEYIPDMRNRVITGQDEVVQLLEGTSSVTNYVPVVLGVNTEVENGVPKGWHSKDYCYDKYYYQEHDEETGELKWKQNERELEYGRVTSRPADWGETWQNYYILKDGSYNQISIDDAVYKEDHYLVWWNIDDAEWNKDYSYYCTKRTDGVQDIYEQVQGITQYGYWTQTERPTDWSENKGNYYVKTKIYEYTIRSYQKKNGGGKKTNEWKVQDLSKFNKRYHIKLKAKKGSTYNYSAENPFGKKTSGSFKVVKVKCLAKGYITVQDYCKITGKDIEKLKWKESKFYTQYDIGQKPPKFQKNKYYYVDKVPTGPPVFSRLDQLYGVYAQDDLIKPPFSDGKYFYQAKDHFSSLVEKAKEQTQKELEGLRKLEGTLEEEAGEFDIGDIVGGKENVTGISGTSYVKKKIVNIDAFKVEIQYDIG